MFSLFLFFLNLIHFLKIIYYYRFFFYKVLQFREKIADISALATNEATLEGMLNRIIDVWKKTDFRLVTDHGKDTYIITGTEEIQILLEESQITMTTIKSSRYVAPIKIQVEDWDRRLTLFSKTLDEWILCQKRWLYLKQIFSTADIQRQLAAETKVYLLRTNTEIYLNFFLKFMNFLKDIQSNRKVLARAHAQNRR
jgi:hypothetical protein